MRRFIVFTLNFRSFMIVLANSAEQALQASGFGAFAEVREKVNIVSKKGQK